MPRASPGRSHAILEGFDAAVLANFGLSRDRMTLASSDLMLGQVHINSSWSVILLVWLLTKPRYSRTIEGNDCAAGTKQARMTTYLLRFQEPVMRLSAGQPCPLKKSTAHLAHEQFAIVAGTKTVTEVRPESADEDPRKHSYFAMQQKGT